MSGRGILEVWSGDTRDVVLKLKVISHKGLMPFLRGYFFEYK